jgi:hypothetical protein
MKYRNLKDRVEDIAQATGISSEKLFNEAWYFLLKKYLLSEWNFEGDRGTFKLRILKIMYHQQNDMLTDSPIFSYTTILRQIVCNNLQEKEMLQDILTELAGDGFIYTKASGEGSDGFMALTTRGVEVGERVFERVYQL